MACRGLIKLEVLKRCEAILFALLFSTLSVFVVGLCFVCVSQCYCYGFFSFYGPLSVERVEFKENVRGFFPQGQAKCKVSVKLGLTLVHYLFHTKW